MGETKGDFVNQENPTEEMCEQIHFTLVEKEKQNKQLEESKRN